MILFSFTISTFTNSNQSLSYFECISVGGKGSAVPIRPLNFARDHWQGRGTSQGRHTRYENVRRGTGTNNEYYKPVLPETQTRLRGHRVIASR